MDTPLPPSSEIPTKIRLQFDFTREALQKLDNLKEKTGAESRAETLRNALRLYEWFVNEASPDSIIEIVNSNSTIVSRLKAQFLLE